MIGCWLPAAGFRRIDPFQLEETVIMPRFSILGLALAAITLALPGAAFAHPGHIEASGFLHGFAHPIGGLDHVLAMVAVGLFAANLGGRALWAVPATFVAVMALGGALGIQGIALPFVETGIALSVVVLGMLIALRVDWPVAAAMAVVGLFAIFHGHAHGAEMPLDASGAAYAAGFMIATALLHSAGIVLGLGVGARREVARLGGAAMTLAGLALLAGVI
jgi:urease accessory protein